MTGVPQGSISGPLLFITFVNGISQYVGTAHANMYADDNLIYGNGDTIADVQDKLQSCVDNVSKRCQVIILLSIMKTLVLCYSGQVEMMDNQLS